jgi:hypothetical protein
MVVYHLFFILNEHQNSRKRILPVSLFLLLIFFLRNFVFIALIPGLVAWILSTKFPKRSFICFVLVYIFATILFFCSGLIYPRANLPAYVTARQQSFMEIGKAGNSTLEVVQLHPNFKSFVANASQALDHALLRPYLSAKGIQYIPFALEICVIEILFLLFIFFRKKNVSVDPLIYFGLFFTFTMMLMTGYTVPILGAIVRYRSIYLIFLLIPIVCYSDWENFRKIFLKKD